MQKRWLAMIAVVFITAACSSDGDSDKDNAAERDSLAASQTALAVQQAALDSTRVALETQTINILPATEPVDDTPVPNKPAISAVTLGQLEMTTTFNQAANGSVHGILWSPDQSLVLIYNPRVKIWRASDGSLVNSIDLVPTGVRWLENDRLMLFQYDILEQAAFVTTFNPLSGDEQRVSLQVELGDFAPSTLGGYFSPDGRRIVVRGFSDQKMQLLDTSSGELIRIVDTPVNSREPIWSANGNLFATWSTSQEAAIFWTAEGVQSIRLPHAMAVEDGAWSPDGTRFFTSTREQLTVWGVAGNVIASLEALNSRARKLIASQDGSRLVYLDNEPLIKVFDVPTESVIYTFAFDSEGDFHDTQYALSPDSTLLAYNNGQVLHLADLVTGQTYRVTEAPSDQKLYTLVWSPDQSTLAVERGLGMIYFWQVGDTASGIVQAAETPTPTAERVALVAEGQLLVQGEAEDGAEELYVINADGSDPQNLTNTAIREETQPRWSPDGEQIVFETFGEIYVMNADGSDVRRLTDNSVEERDPSWSPDGSQIVYVSGEVLQSEIYVMNADGSNPRQLTDNDLNDGGPVWSPDGSLIAYSSNPGRQFSIYVMNADGSDARPLVTSTPNASCPSWSPDGTQLAYSVDDRSGGNSQIYVVNRDGSDPHPVTEAGVVALCPTWSPDGLFIAYFSAASLFAADFQLVIMEADGFNPTVVVTSVKDPRLPMWKP